MTRWPCIADRRVVWRGQLLVFVMGTMLAPWAGAQQAPSAISFRKAIELALTHSAGMGIAMADEIKARQSYLESRNAFIPQITLGSGVGQTWGYPMSIEGSAPSVFNITSQSSLFNPAQLRFTRAARTDWSAADLSAADQRSAVILETALTYLQLDQTTGKRALLQQAAEEAERAEAASRARLQEGINSKVDVARAALTAARMRMRLAEAQGSADLLRQRLAQLTGLDAHTLDTDGSSIPPRPEISQQDDLAARAADNNPAVKAAEEKAKARELQAQGEHRLLYPTVDLAGNYGLFSKYNNLNLLFPQGQFSRNNATFGVDIRFGFLNAVQRARVQAANAEALRARSEARALREQLSNDTLKLQRTVQQLAAARDVAQLEAELAQSNIDAVQAKVETGAATITDQQNARIEASNKQAALFDAQFDLDRTRLQLLRTTNDLEKWALP